MIQYNFNKSTTIEAILYICNKLGGSRDVYSLIKMLYFADLAHLQAYGRPITGDRIIAMDHGPVLSNTYDIIKLCNTDGFRKSAKEDYIITANREADTEELSQSEINILCLVIEKYKDYSFGELKYESHDQAYDKAIKNNGLNSTVDYEYIFDQLSFTDEEKNVLAEWAEDSTFAL